jgi:hypothetical protein
MIGEAVAAPNAGENIDNLADELAGFFNLPAATKRELLLPEQSGTIGGTASPQI